MTHGELLAKIDTIEARYTDYPTYLAFRSVVELHKPEMRYDSKPFCSVCFTEGQPYEQADDVYYPCPTIKVIEAALND